MSVLVCLCTIGVLMSIFIPIKLYVFFNRFALLARLRLALMPVLCSLSWGSRGSRAGQDRVPRWAGCQALPAQSRAWPQPEGWERDHAHGQTSHVSWEIGSSAPGWPSPVLLVPGCRTAACRGLALHGVGACQQVPGHGLRCRPCRYPPEAPALACGGSRARRWAASM